MIQNRIIQSNENLKIELHRKLFYCNCRLSPRRTHSIRLVVLNVLAMYVPRLAAKPLVSLSALPFRRQNFKHRNSTAFLYKSMLLLKLIMYGTDVF